MPVAPAINETQTTATTETQTSQLIEELRAVREAAHRMMARVADDQAFCWQPHDGRGWSVGQCLDHLSQGNRAYLAGIRDALANAPRGSAPVTAPLRSTWFGRTFAASMEPGTMKMRAPKTIVPRSATNRQQVWTEFLRGLDEMEAVLGDAQTIDLNRHAFANPFFTFARVRVGTGFRILLAHMRRHIQQAERVLDARISVAR